MFRSSSASVGTSSSRNKALVPHARGAERDWVSPWARRAAADGGVTRRPVSHRPVRSVTSWLVMYANSPANDELQTLCPRISQTRHRAPASRRPSSTPASQCRPRPVQRTCCRAQNPAGRASSGDVDRAVEIRPVHVDAPCGVTRSIRPTPASCFWRRVEPHFS
jgi:hypothetical protein